MTSRAVEDYLKRLYLEQHAVGDGEATVSTGRLAGAMNVTPGSATAMLKALAQAGLVDHEPRRGARLTPKGEQLALHMVRRHRLLELFLVETLGLDWTIVHEEAERLEHAVSDRVLERIDAMLGYPTVDPHGDPIPSRQVTGHVENPTRMNLADCPLETPLRVVRVLDQDPAFLRFIQTESLGLGAVIQVLDRNAASGVLRLQCADRTLVLGASAAPKLLVELAGD